MTGVLLCSRVPSPRCHTRESKSRRHVCNTEDELVLTRRSLLFAADHNRQLRWIYAAYIAICEYKSVLRVVSLVWKKRREKNLAHLPHTQQLPPHISDACIQFIVSPGTGALSDIYGRKRILVSCATAWAVASIMQGAGFAWWLAVDPVSNMHSCTCAILTPLCSSTSSHSFVLPLTVSRWTSRLPLRPQPLPCSSSGVLFAVSLGGALAW